MNKKKFSLSALIVVVFLMIPFYLSQQKDVKNMITSYRGSVIKYDDNTQYKCIRYLQQTVKEINATNCDRRVKKEYEEIVSIACEEDNFNDICTYYISNTDILIDSMKY